MRTTQWVRRLAVTGCAAGIGLAVVGVSTASAQGDPTGPAPITISAAEVQQLCEVKVPPIKAEVTKLVTWINAGPTVTGSTQWLHAQAQKAQAGGHPALADILNGRAERRTGVLVILQGIQTKIDNFDSAHCAYLGGGS
jgi:hypothetical protein